jgi:hypothetical protein
VAERFLLNRFLIADNPRNQPRYGVNDHQCGDLSSAEDIVTNREFLINKWVNTLVDALVAAT